MLHSSGQYSNVIGSKGIEWFGSLSSKHGIAEVYLNNTLHSKVNAYHSTWLKRQRLFGIDHLPYGNHRLSIINTGRKSQSSNGTFIDIDAFVVNPGNASSSCDNSCSKKRSAPLGIAGTLLDLLPPSQVQKSISADASPTWSLMQVGDTRVHAMQLAVISATHAIVIDKVEHNTITIDGHPAWAALYDLRTNEVRPLNMRSNSFCAGGTFLSNGTFINVGGNPVVVDSTGAADFGDLNGLQAVRLFHPELCDDQGNGCDIIEAPHRLRLASPRWYNTVLRLDDGSAMILGGSTRGGWINNATTNNPTIEYFPPKNINGFNGVPIPSPFLVETLNSNLFPIAFLLPDGRVFVAANQDAMIYDWKSNEEKRLPRIPNGVRVTYPMTGTAVLLPLSSTNNYIPTVLICGGSSIDDNRPGYAIDSQEAASSQCVRLELSDDGVQQGWQVEPMPRPRVMPDSLLLPTGDVLIVNGGETGIAGYGNVKNQIGFSNADHPVLTPVIYRSSSPPGSRFSSDGMPTSEIPRLYHSVATLVPDGRIMIAGSNPNLDRSTTRYGTEYRVEWLAPAWMEDDSTRPNLNVSISILPYGAKFSIMPDLKGGDMNQVKSEWFSIDYLSLLMLVCCKVALMDLGFVTHSLHMNGRLVYLDFESTDGGSLLVHGPPSAGVYPPGPGWIYLIVGDKWSQASYVMVGTGSNPPEDPGALENMLTNSNVSGGSVEKSGGEGAESI